jgi:hypothetical protein
VISTSKSKDHNTEHHQFNQQQKYDAKLFARSHTYSNHNIEHTNERYEKDKK